MEKHFGRGEGVGGLDWGERGLAGGAGSTWCRIGGGGCFFFNVLFCGLHVVCSSVVD